MNLAGRAYVGLSSIPTSGRAGSSKLRRHISKLTNLVVAPFMPQLNPSRVKLLALYWIYVR